MLRLFIPIGFLIFFIGWILYRWLFKRDLKKNQNGIIVGLLFIGVWTVIYFALLKL